MMIKRLEHLQDLHDLVSELKDKLPIRIQYDVDKPINGSDYERWRNANAFFHGAIVPFYSEHTGQTRKEAKEDLQKMFALVSDNDGIYVESISEMNLPRIQKLILECNVFLSETFGEIPEKPMTVKTKKL